MFKVFVDNENLSDTGTGYRVQVQGIGYWVTALWSLQIIGCGLHQEISRNFNGIRDSATPKWFYSPFIENQLY